MRNSKNIIEFYDAVFYRSLFLRYRNASHSSVARDSGNNDVAKFFKQNKSRPFLYLEGIGKLDICKNHIACFKHVPMPHLRRYPITLSSWAAGFYTKTRHTGFPSLQYRRL